MPARPPRITRAVPWTATTLLVVAALAPFGLPPTGREALAIVIGATELSPVVAVAAVVLAVVVWFATPRERGLRLTLVAACLAAAAIALVPTVRARLAARKADSEIAALAPLSEAPPRARDADVQTFDLTMHADDGTPLTYRIVRPAHAAYASPVIVDVYGGAWQRGTARDDDETNRYFAALGYVVFAIDYRHAPAHPWPAQLDDVRLALGMLRDSATAWHADADRVVLWGRSSGGHLAARSAWDTLPLPVHVRGVIDFYGPFDLSQAYRDLPNPDPLDVRSILRAFTRGTPSDAPAVYRAASPSTFVRPGLPPTLLVYGGRDHTVLAAFGRAAAASVRRAGNRVVYVELPDAEHAFDVVPNGVHGRVARELVERFLGVVTR